MLGNFAAYLLKMSKNLPTGPAKGPEDVCIAFAVHLWQGNPGLTLAQVMLASHYLTCPKNPVCQMWVLRRCPSKKEMKKPAPSVALKSTVHGFSSLASLGSKTLQVMATMKIQLKLKH